MKVKCTILAVVAAAVSATAAMAAPPASHPGKGVKPPTTGAGCKPQIMVVLRGSVAAAPDEGATLPFNLMVTVKSANWHGKAFVKATQPVPVSVSSSTRIVRHGKASLSSLLLGDLVKVQARVCRADLADGATPALNARLIVAHAAKAQKSDSDSESDSQSNTTTTTTTTTQS